jgi:two-component system phosphate regulon response regulator PhoB
MPNHILLVDDDDFARGFVRAVLERAGFEVREAEGLEDALSMTRARQPKAVVTDWHLLDGNGGELANSLREMAPRLPVILITADADRIEQFQEAEKLEFASILRKPFSPSALETAIRAAIADDSSVLRG